MIVSCSFLRENIRKEVNKSLPSLLQKLLVHTNIFLACTDQPNTAHAQEARVIAKIKAEAKRDPNSKAVAILAKELVNNRNTQKRLLVSASKIDSVGHRMTSAAATMKMTQAMGVAAKVFC